MRVAVTVGDLVTHKEALEDWAWEPVPGAQTATCLLDPGLRDRLGELGIAYETQEAEAEAGGELREQVEAIERWYLNDWVALDAKLRTSIVEGISVAPIPSSSNVSPGPGCSSSMTGGSLLYPARARHDLLEVLDDRYARRGTILASQVPVEHCQVITISVQAETARSLPGTESEASAWATAGPTSWQVEVEIFQLDSSHRTGYPR